VARWGRRLKGMQFRVWEVAIWPCDEAAATLWTR
jgi:hypothetical protein